MVENCSSCRWWCLNLGDPFVDDGEDMQGQCRRYPPQIDASHPDKELLGISFGFFPFTDGDTWCGEWERGPDSSLRLNEWLNLHDFTQDRHIRRLLAEADCLLQQGRTFDEIVKIRQWQRKRSLLPLVKRLCDERYP